MLRLAGALRVLLFAVAGTSCATDGRGTTRSMAESRDGTVPSIATVGTAERRDGEGPPSEFARAFPESADPADDRAAAAEETALAEAFQAVLGSAPLAVPRLNYFHSALEVPPLDTARTLPEGTFWGRVRTSHARSNHEEEANGIKNDFDGTFHEWLALEATWAAAEDLEIGARAVLAGWDEHEDRFNLFDDQGVPIVSEETTLTTNESSSRHINLSVFGVRLKRRLLRSEDAGWDLAVAPSFKFPTGRDRDLTNAGTYDAALTLLATFPVSWGTVHANLGITRPIGDQNLFEPEADVDVDPFFHGGVGLVVPLDGCWSVAAQIEANTSAFEDVTFLDEDPVTFVLGVRRTTGKWFLELGVGTGFDWDAAYEYVVHVGVGYRF